MIPAILSADIIEYCFWHGLCVTIQNLGSGKMEKEETERVSETARVKFIVGMLRH